MRLKIKNSAAVFLQVMDGSSLTVTAQLLHVPQAPAAGSDPHLEPYPAVSAADAGGSNILTITPGALQPLPERFATAVAAAGGALTCALALHLPASRAGAQHGGSCEEAGKSDDQCGPRLPGHNGGTYAHPYAGNGSTHVAVATPGVQSGDKVVWSTGTRAYLSPSAVASLKVWIPDTTSDSL